MSRPYVRQPFRQGSKSWLTEGIFTINNFGGGMNNVEPDTVIEDNEMTNTQNMRFISANLMEKRQGTKEYNSTTYPAITKLIEGVPTAQSVTWVDEYYPLEGEPVFVRGTASEVYIGNTKLCDVQGSIRGVTYVGKYYFVDGKYLYVYNGTTYFKVVQEPMTYLASDYASGTSITVESIPAQTNVGDKVFFLSSIMTGATASVTKTISAINTETKVITLDAAPGYPIPATKNTKKNPIYLYEPLNTTFILGEEVWDDVNHLAYYKPCANELADDYCGGSYIPTAPSVITVHTNRLFLSGDDESPNVVYMSGYSAVAPQPLYFPSAASVSVKPNGQPIIDLIVFDDALIMGRNEDMFVLYGNSEYPTSVVANGTPFYIKQMDVATGFMNVDCGALLNNFYVYLGYDGRFYKLNTPTTFVEYLMSRPIDFKCDIYSAPISITKNTVVITACVAYRNEVIFNLSNAMVVVYNYDNMGFTFYTGWNADSLYTDGNTLYIGRHDGKLAYWCDGEGIYTDLDAAIVAKQYTKRFDFGASANYKYFKRFMITTQTYDALLSSVDVNAEVDYFYVYDATVSCDTTIFDSNKSMFGIAEWGDIFTNKDIIKSKYTNLDIKGRTVQFRFENDKTHTLEDESVAGEPFRVYDINLMYSSRDVR